MRVWKAVPSMAAKSSSWAVWIRFQPRVMPPSSELTKYSAVAVVPAQAQQAGLAGAVLVEALGEVADFRSGAFCDGLEDVAGGGEAGLNAGVGRVHAAGDDAADAGDERGLLFHGDDAGGGADDVDDVALAAACADRVPVGVKGAYGDWDTSFETHCVGPVWRRGGRRYGPRFRRCLQTCRGCLPGAGRAW